MTKQKFTSDQKVEMLTRYAAGQTLKEIAAEYGCIPHTVSRMVTELDPAALRGTSSNGRKSRYDAGQKTKIFERYIAGETADEIGVDYGCSRQTILRIVREHDSSVIRPSGPNKLTDEQKNEIAVRYSNGESFNALAKAYDCSVPNISQIIQNRGVTARPLGLPPQTDETVEEVRKRRLSGKSYRQIGNELGLHYGTVGDICRRRLGLAYLDLDENDETTQLVRLPGSLPGEASPAWRGGRYVRYGYAMVYVADDDPLRCMASSLGYVPEHRLVMARKLGRPLRRGETVHHINGDGLDNDPSNLQLRQGNHGTGVVMRCADCGSHNLEFMPIAD